MKYLKYFLTEAKKVWIYFLVFLTLYIIMSCSLFMVDTYQPAQTLVIDNNYMPSINQLISGVGIEYFMICGFVGFIIFSSMSIFMIDKLFNAEIKQKNLSNSLTLPFSRSQIIITKLSVPIISALSILFVSGIIETTALTTYQYNGEQGNFAFFYPVMILNYFNFMLIIFLTISIYFGLYVLIAKRMLANIITSIIFTLFIINAAANYLYSIYLDPDGVRQNLYLVCNIFHYLSPDFFSNNNLYFDISHNGFPSQPGIYLIISDLITTNFQPNAWKIPVMLILIVVINWLTILKFKTSNFYF